MTKALIHRRDYLADNRRMVISRSLAAAAAGAVPVPLVEEWLASAVKRRTLARIAESRAVDASDKALSTIADGVRQAPEWTEIAGGTLIARLLSRTWRRLLVAAIAARRAQVAGHNFQIATLFDHYCARMHVGLGLDAITAAELRDLMDQAIARTHGGLSRRMFRRALAASAKATAKAPFEVANKATGGALRRLLTSGDEIAAITEVDEEIEKQLATTDSFLARAALAVELQLSAEENPYLDNLIATFEALWRTRRDQDSHVDE